MRQRPKTIQEPVFGFDKPAKERIIEASDKLFRLFGIRVSHASIAHEAHSNVETLAKYFGYGDNLISRFVESMIADCDARWRSIEAAEPGNAEAQLRLWLAMEQHMGIVLEPQALLARTAAELYQYRKVPLLDLIEQYWHAERRRVVGLCRSAGLRDPLALGDKLLLLVHGVRNERNAYGRHAPSRLLEQAGNDLLVAHGASSKPPVAETIETDKI